MNKLDKDLGEPEDEIIFDEKKEDILSKTMPAVGDTPFYPQVILTNDTEANQVLPVEDSGYYTDGRETNRGYQSLSFASLFNDIKNILKNKNKI